MKKFEATANEWWVSIPFLLGLAAVLVMHGAVPGIAVPTTGQAIWTTGFSQSFANDSISSIYAHNFGLPEPAAIAFGLAGAYTASLFITAGMNPADAYSAMAAFWLFLSFFGAFRFGLLLGLNSLMAVLLAVLWMSMPIIWAHSGYSMLSMGIGLLPFYFWTGMRLFFSLETSRKGAFISAALYCLACLIAVFMDGYSFMMFAVGSSLLAAYMMVHFVELRRRVIVFFLPVHAFSFGLAYLLYTTYIGQRQFESASLDHFRGWGVDLTFIAIPTQGMHWLWDRLGWSVPRSDSIFFGDPSVWVTTFSLPIIILGLVGWWNVRKFTKVANAFLILAVFGFYMALGPSVKINSTKPSNLQSEKPGQLSAMMPEELAIVGTGNAWISEHLPGFNNMRASYRWCALGVFAFWALLVLMVSSNKRSHIMYLSMMLMLLISNLPHLGSKWANDKAYRDIFNSIDENLVSDMEEMLREDELVAFLPYSNDFLVNYLASKLKIRTFNIGGDKNLSKAQQQWPGVLNRFQMAQIDQGFAERVLLLFARHETDVVVLPYIDMLAASYNWPPHLIYKNALDPVIDVLRDSGYVSVDERKYYAVVRSLRDFSEVDVLPVVYPISVEQQPLSFSLVLGKGWFGLGANGVWSTQQAELRLPVPDKCISKECNLIVVFSVFGASEKRPVNVIFKSDRPDLGHLASLMAKHNHIQYIKIPLLTNDSLRRVFIDIPEATSPKALQQSRDYRVLGVSLFSIDWETSVSDFNESKNNQAE